MAREKLFHVGIKALITNSEGKVLVLKANPAKFLQEKLAHWDIPGGRISEGESADEALAREIEEETGISEIIGAENFTSVISNIEIPISDAEQVGLVLIVYKVVIPDDAVISLSDEHTEYEWADPLVAAERLLHKYPRIFTDAVRSL